ncbi:MAG TPA: hypothetical protein VJ914_09000 [Pseudonocardiaceae bacterium]|nr:hypothetical protein [Pseudonocardiaceae bacterium]
MVFHAQFLFAHGDPAGAEGYARRTIELRPDAAFPFGILEKSLARQGKLSAAWDAVVAGVAIDAEEFDDFAAVAGFVIEPLGLDLSVELAVEAVRVHPGVAPLRVWLAALYTQAGEFDLAWAEFDTVLGLGPSATARELAVQCIELCDDPVELRDLRQAFSAGG